MKFELTLEEEKMVRAWELSHRCTEPRKSYCEGKIRYSFTPTDIGTAVDVTCICGKKITIREL